MMWEDESILRCAFERVVIFQCVCSLDYPIATAPRSRTCTTLSHLSVTAVKVDIDTQMNMPICSKQTLHLSI